MILAFLQLLDGELSSALTSISSIPELVTALKRFAPAAAGVLTGTVVMVFVGFAPMEHLTITVRVVSVLVQAILSGISSWICANSSWRVSVLRGIASARSPPATSCSDKGKGKEVAEEGRLVEAGSSPPLGWVPAEDGDGYGAVGGEALDWTLLQLFGRLSYRDRDRDRGSLGSSPCRTWRAPGSSPCLWTALTEVASSLASRCGGLRRLRGHEAAAAVASNSNHCSAVVWAKPAFDAATGDFQLDADAAVERMASGLVGTVRRGDTVLVLASRLVKLLFAVPLIPPNPSRPGVAHAHLLRAVSQTKPSAAVSQSQTGARYIASVAGASGKIAVALSGLRWQSVEDLEEEGVEGGAPVANAMAAYLIQDTSGATKPVVVTAGSAAHNDLGPDGVIVSWLPQYHDCGLMFLLLSGASPDAFLLEDDAAFLDCGSVDVAAIRSLRFLTHATLAARHEALESFKIGPDPEPDPLEDARRKARHEALESLKIGPCETRLPICKSCYNASFIL
ncbi:hypothetical protein ACQ4PT_026070 [Festuca glaucescens]